MIRLAKMNKILLGAVALVLVFVIVFVGVLFWMKSSSGTKKTEAKNLKTTAYAITDPIVANLADDSTVNIRVAVTLETVTDAAFDAKLKADDSLARTVIITVLRHKKVSEVSPTTAPDAPLNIRQEIVDELNKAYNTDKFVGVNFREFITQ